MATSKELTSYKNLMELSSIRDFRLSTPISMKYLILGSPRSGSTLVSRILFETKMAGDPLEFFNRYLLELECEIKGIKELTFDRFLDEMKLRRTSPNGVFGMQLHYPQLLMKFSSDNINNSMIGFVRDFDKYIWLRRRNKLRQAISFVIAKTNGAWSSEDKKKIEKLEVEDISMIDILSALRFVSFNDFGWERLIHAAKLDVHEVWYEDLVTNYESVCSGIFNFLQINSNIEMVPRPPISRQGSELNEKLYSDALTWLGLNEEPL
jgi:LPS sulfotransferase NodH